MDSRAAPHHDSEEEDHHDHDEFESFVLDLPEVADVPALIATIDVVFGEVDR